MMKLIKFNKKYYQMILNQIKTQTIRKNNKRLNVSETVKAIFPGMEKELTLKIVKCGYKQFKYLDEDDAVREGYDSLNELKNELLEIYPRLDNLDRIYYYQFELIK